MLTLPSIVRYHERHFDGVRLLWRKAFPDDPPWNAAEIAIPAKLKVQSELFLVAINHGEVVGSIMAGYDGHRGWLYAAAVLHTQLCALALSGEMSAQASAAAMITFCMIVLPPSNCARRRCNLTPRSGRRP